MKPIILAAVAGISLASLPAVSMAACAAPSLRVATAAAMNALLQGNTVCVPAVTQTTMVWQELHMDSGALVDYKRGPTDTVDPSKQVGTWTVTGLRGGGAIVTHDYGGGTQFTYEVWANTDGITHSFCRQFNPEVIARITPGPGAC